MQNNFLSDYIILQTIGKGTFSVVKLGINKKTKEKVAIKILKKKKIIHKTDKIRLEREISILKKLNHINVIKIHKINEDQEKYYIVMEYCENGELFNYIVDRRKLDENQSSYFFYQLINGLDYIHHKNIVHRDLKPENLLLGKGNILKIVDFGLSNYVEKEKLLSTPCGSPCYASPEMVCGNSYNGILIDIWSCGIIIYAMTCGFLPFEDYDNDILFKKIMDCKIDYPKFLSKNIVDIMKKILVVEPEKRITIPEIKKHPFYLKGKKLFELKHKKLVCLVEKIINDEEENINEKNNINKEEIIISNIKKSKSTNFLDDENENLNLNDDGYNNELNKIKNQNKLQKILKNISLLKKGIDISPARNQDNSAKDNKHEVTVFKKFHINKEKSNINNEINKIMSIKYEKKEINNKTNEEQKINSIKKINKNVLGLMNKKSKTKIDSFNSNIVNELSRKTQNHLLSDDNLQRNKNKIENFEKNRNNINPIKKSKINLSLLQQLLNKEENIKYNKEKKFIVYSPNTKKNKDNITYILSSKKQKSEEKIESNNSKREQNITNISEKQKNKTILDNSSIRYDSNENNIKSFEYLKMSPKINSDNKVKLDYKIQKNLDLIKYGISNKDISEILYKNNSTKKIFKQNTTKNYHYSKTKKLVNNENKYNSTNKNKNIHIKNLRILNNNIKNITNINNIFISNSSLKSIIKDGLKKVNNNNNNDLPNINNTIFSLINSNQSANNNTGSTNRNVLIPKLVVNKDINKINNIKINYANNLSKIYSSPKNKSIKNIDKKNSINNLINNYRNSASSNDYLNKKTLSKKHISERNSFGSDFMNIENENNSANKKNIIIYNNKNNSNLNIIQKSKLDPFTYGRNNENLISLKKSNYHSDSQTNFNSAQNNSKNILPYEDIRKNIIS